jgi:hypothetical protein
MALSGLIFTRVRVSGPARKLLSSRRVRALGGSARAGSEAIGVKTRSRQ